MNPLDEYPEVRKAMYLVQWVVNGGLGIAGIVLTILGESPQWFIILTAVFNFVWTYSGVTAQNNIVVPEEGEHRAEPDELGG